MKRQNDANDERSVYKLTKLDKQERIREELMQGKDVGMQNELRKEEKEFMKSSVVTEQNQILSNRDGDCTDATDRMYFNAYSEFGIHRDMIGDYVRTNTYRHAILSNWPLFYQKIVCDIGAGTGILSLFCAQAGAKRVYAVEADMADTCARLVAENNMSDRIIVLKCKAEELVQKLPPGEKFDVIVSEWMGYSLLYESMLSSVLHARDRFLKANTGVLFPCKAELYCAPFACRTDENRDTFWEDMSDLYKIKLSAVRDLEMRALSHQVQVDEIAQQQVYAHAHKALHLDLLAVTIDELHRIESSSFHFDCFGSGQIDGLVTWFDVEFPGGHVLSTSPYKARTHWAQSLMYLDAPISVQQGVLIDGNLTLITNNDRTLDFIVKISNPNGKATVKKLKLS